MEEEEEEEEEEMMKTTVRSVPDGSDKDSIYQKLSFIHFLPLSDAEENW